MKVLITGTCGFAGTNLARGLRDLDSTIELFGIDNFIRPGNDVNRLALRNFGIAVHPADLRHASNIDALPESDWLIDAAANPSVLAGVSGVTSSRGVGGCRPIRSTLIRGSLVIGLTLGSEIAP